MNLSVIIPVYNEAKTLVETHKQFTEILSTRSEISYELIFVNDHSQDGSAAILSNLKNNDLKVKIVSHETNLGKGAAIKTGLKKAEGDIILLGDADLELDPRQCLKLIEPILCEKAELVNGSRYLYSNHIRNYRSAANKIFGAIFRLITFSKVSDFACGYKAIARRTLLDFKLKESGFGIEAELMMKACKKGVTILEVPVTYNARTTKEGKKLKNIDALKILLVLIKYRLTK